jgi:hypothetical protein
MLKFGALKQKPQFYTRTLRRVVTVKKIPDKSPTEIVAFQLFHNVPPAGFGDFSLSLPRSFYLANLQKLFYEASKSLELEGCYQYYSPSLFNIFEAHNFNLGTIQSRIFEIQTV